MKVPTHTCASCHWSCYHDVYSGSIYYGDGPEPGYYTCPFDPTIMLMECEIGTEMICWMPPEEEEEE